MNNKLQTNTNNGFLTTFIPIICVSTMAQNYMTAHKVIHHILTTVGNLINWMHYTDWSLTAALWKYNG